MNEDTFDTLEELAGHLSRAIRLRADQALTILTDIARLTTQSCSGTPYWRDQNEPGKQPKLIVVHGIDEECSIHGAPEPGERIRIYVGVDPAKIREAEAAMARFDEVERLQRVHRRLTRGLHRAHWQIRDVFPSLLFTLPKEGPPKPEELEV